MASVGLPDSFVADHRWYRAGSPGNHNKFFSPFDADDSRNPHKPADKSAQENHLDMYLGQFRT